MRAAAGNDDRFSVGTERHRVRVSDRFAADIQSQLFLIRRFAIGKGKFREAVINDPANINHARSHGEGSINGAGQNDQLRIRRDDRDPGIKTSVKNLAGTDLRKRRGIMDKNFARYTAAGDQPSIVGGDCQRRWNPSHGDACGHGDFVGGRGVEDLREVQDGHSIVTRQCHKGATMIASDGQTVGLVSHGERHKQTQFGFHPFDYGNRSVPLQADQCRIVTDPGNIDGNSADGNLIKDLHPREVHETHRSCGRVGGQANSSV